MKKILLIIFLATKVLPLFAEITQDQEKIFLELENRFHQAMNLLDQDQMQAKQMFMQTAIDYTNKIIGKGFCSAGIYYNTGNAYYMAGDYGRAILNYRRGLLIEPVNSDLKFNLESARAARTDDFTGLKRITPLKVLLFWHYYTGRVTKIVLSLLFLTSFLTFLLLKIYRQLNVSLMLLIPLFLFGVLLSVLFYISDAAARNTVEGVIISSEVTLRKGDNRSYESVIDGTIHNGTEFELIKERNGWMYISIPGIEKGWVEDKNAVIIN